VCNEKDTTCTNSGSPLKTVIKGRWLRQYSQFFLSLCINVINCLFFVQFLTWDTIVSPASAVCNTVYPNLPSLFFSFFVNPFCIGFPTPPSQLGQPEPRLLATLIFPQRLTMPDKVSQLTAVAMTQVKLGPYHEEEPAIWFHLIEAQFAMAGIMSQKLKYENTLLELGSCYIFYPDLIPDHHLR
jgi:hypothetical protein